MQKELRKETENNVCPGEGIVLLCCLFLDGRNELSRSFFTPIVTLGVTCLVFGLEAKEPLWPWAQKS